jgi:spore germination protein GerM
LSGAIEELLAGPKNATVTTTIPPETKLRSLIVKDDGIHIDLSKDFTQGGGSTSMTGRLGQVLYTATSLNPNAKVWVSVEGQPLETLGGEGLMLDQPLTRESFKRDFPL